MSLLRRFEMEAAREEARAFASELPAFARTPALPLRVDAGLDDSELANAPLLIAREEPSTAEVASPPVELPPDLIDVLAEAA